MFDFFGIGTIASDPEVRDDGIYVKVTCQPAGDGPWPARVAVPSAGPGYGQHFPYEKEDTVLWCCPGGDPGDGLYVLARFYERAEPTPKAVLDAPKAEQWIAMKGRNLALWSRQGDLRLTSVPEEQDDGTPTTRADLLLATDGTISAVPPADKQVQLGDTAAANLDWLVLYTELKAQVDANTAAIKLHTHLAGALVAGMVPVTGVTGTPVNPGAFQNLTAGIRSSNVVAKK